MKQNITKQQVYDLGVAPENMIKLGKLTRTDYEGMVNGIMLFDKVTLESAIDEVVEQISTDFSIGKMIEILNNNIPRTDNIEDSIDIEIDRAVEVVFVEFRKDNSFVEFESNELCDALWEAVKTIL